MDSPARPAAAVTRQTGGLNTPGVAGDTPRALARRLRPSVGWARHIRLPRPGLAWEEPPAQWGWSQALDWISRNRLEIAAVTMLTILAAFVRIYRLAEVPEGLHGDEAWTGLDAVRILRDGWIGPWSGSALGQPSGASYFTSLVFGLSDHTLFTLRLSMALLGVATIPAAYVLFRIGFGRWVALFATIALTFSFWHVFYSRVALPVIAMPLMTTMASAALLVALRSSTRWAWVMAGALLALGIYTYTGYIVFPVTIALFVAIVLMLGRDRLRYYGVRVAVLAIACFIVALPMITVAYSDPGFFFQRFRTLTSATQTEYQASESLGTRLNHLASRTWDTATLLVRHSRIDGSDGMGGRGVLDPILAMFAYAGLVVAIFRWRSPPHLLLALAFVLGLGTSIVKPTGWGELRQTFVIVPFVYGLAGVAVVELFRWLARRLGGRAKLIPYAAGTAILVVAASLNVSAYADHVQKQDLDWVYAPDLVGALQSAHAFDEPGVAYCYSNRWSYNYETRRFLYPDSSGVDRSREFGEFSLEKVDEGPVTYILLPPYDQEIETLRRLYPGGETIEEFRPDGSRLFSIYHLP